MRLYMHGLNKNNIMIRNKMNKLRWHCNKGLNEKKPIEIRNNKIELFHSNDVNKSFEKL